MAIGEQFSGLDMQQLISGPLSAAAEASAQLAELTADFINREEFDAKRKEYKSAIESIVIPTIPELPETWQEVYEKLDNQKKNILWKTVINHIEIKDKKVDIYFESTKVLAERMSMLDGKQDIGKQDIE